MGPILYKVATEAKWIPLKYALLLLACLLLLLHNHTPFYIVWWSGVILDAIFVINVGDRELNSYRFNKPVLFFSLQSLWGVGILSSVLFVNIQNFNLPSMFVIVGATIVRVVFTFKSFTQ